MRAWSEHVAQRGIESASGALVFDMRMLPVGGRCLSGKWQRALKGTAGYETPAKEKGTSTDRGSGGAGSRRPEDLDDCPQAAVLGEQGRRVALGRHKQKVKSCEVRGGESELGARARGVGVLGRASSKGHAGGLLDEVIPRH